MLTNDAEIKDTDMIVDEYQNLTWKEARALAKQKGLSLQRTMNREDVIQLLKG